TCETGYLAAAPCVAGERWQGRSIVGFPAHGVSKRHVDGWTKALIFSVLWVGLVGAVGYFHTDVFLAGQITPAEDHAISEKYGDLAVMDWAWCGWYSGCDRAGYRNVRIPPAATLPKKSTPSFRTWIVAERKILLRSNRSYTTCSAICHQFFLVAS